MSMGIAGLVLLVSLCGGEPAPRDEGGVPGASWLPFGEVLVYRIRVPGMAIGEAVLSVAPEPEDLGGRRAVRLTMTLRSNAFVSAFHPVDDRMDSLVDLATGGTLLYRVHKKEGRRRPPEIEELTFFPDEGRVEFHVNDRTGEARTPWPVLDALSCIYHLRRPEFKIGRTERFAVHQRGKTWDVGVTADGFRRMKLRRLGSFWAFKLVPEAGMPGILSSRRGQAVIWTEETTGIPLRFTVDLPFGSGAMILIRAENSPLLSAPGAVGRRAEDTGDRSGEPSPAPDEAVPSVRKDLPPVPAEAAVTGEGRPAEKK